MTDFSLILPKLQRAGYVFLIPHFGVAGHCGQGFALVTFSKFKRAAGN